ncbi:MAG: hypothetical protein ACRD2T_08380 [Thermoanaerobaculia bacterium]
MLTLRGKALLRLLDARHEAVSYVSILMVRPSGAVGGLGSRLQEPGEELLALGAGEHMAEDHLLARW